MDISQKITSQLRIKRERGEFVGGNSVYGYKRSPSDRHQLVVDEPAAAVVRDIFRWRLEGLSADRIAQRLNQMGVPSPAEYKRIWLSLLLSQKFLGISGVWPACANK